MARPEQIDWQRVSSLHDQLEAMPAAERDALLADLAARSDPLAPVLKRMFEEAGGLLGDGFLQSLPVLTGVGDAATQTDGAAPGQSVGAYRLLRPLGKGGMAEVWLAERADGAFVRQVALKLLHPQPVAARADGFARRFAREHRILATLRHPNVAALHDAGVTPEGLHWLALEVVDGQPIDAWCDAARLSVRGRVQLFMQALHAVAHAHAKLVIHRDLKPSNMLVTAQGELRLLDFGIAAMLDADEGAGDDLALTRQAGRPLTPRYASPEQLRGEALDVATDIYSLGVMLHELLCGQSPYEETFAGAPESRPRAPPLSLGTIERAMLDDRQTAPSRRAATPQALAARGATARALRRSLWPELDAVVLRAMALRPADRYPTVDALAADLGRWLAHEPVLARLPGPVERLVKFVRRNPWSSALGTAAALSLSVATGMVMLSAHEAALEAARARTSSDFLLHLFDDADPDRHGGKAQTPAQLLARGRERLSATAATTPPALHRELLARLAQVQTEMSAHTDAEASWAQWLTQCGPGCTAGDRAYALTRRAENDLRRGEYAAARDALSQAEAVLPAARSAPLEQAKRLEVAGHLALRERRFDAAQQAFSQAIRHADGLPAGGDVRQDTLWLAVAEAEAGRRDADAALRALDAAAAAGKDSASDPQHMMARTAVLARLGRYALLLDRADAQRAQCELQLRPGGEICTRLRNRHLRAWVRSGQPQPVLALWPSLAPLIDAEPINNDSLISLLMVHRAATLAGATAIAEATAQRLDAVERQHRSAVLRAHAAMALAEQSLSVSDLRGAGAHMARARLHAAEPAAAGNLNLAAQLDLAEGQVAQAQGDAARALTLMQQAQREFDRSDGPLHPLPQLLGLNQVAPLRALGRAAQAQALLETALPILRSSLGADAPTVLRAEALAAWRAPSAPAEPPSTRARPAPAAALRPFG
jgi:serine/threonine-protein kinase